MTKAIERAVVAVLVGTFKLSPADIDEMVQAVLAKTEWSKVQLFRVIPDKSASLLSWAEARKDLMTKDAASWISLYETKFFNNSYVERNNASVNGNVAKQGKAGLVIQLGDLIGHYTPKDSKTEFISHIENFLMYQLGLKDHPVIAQVIKTESGKFKASIEPKKWHVHNQGERVLRKATRKQSEGNVQKSVEASVASLMP